MNYTLFMINFKRILRENYTKYLVILLLSFFLSRELLLDVPMVNESRVPLKITNMNVIINSFFHSILLVLFIFMYEIFYN